jgi:hypothetical protein
VARFPQRDATAEAEPLRQSLEAIASYLVPKLAELRPELPEALGDRAQDSSMLSPTSTRSNTPTRA